MSSKKKHSDIPRGKGKGLGAKFWRRISMFVVNRLLYGITVFCVLLAVFRLALHLLFGLRHAPLALLMGGALVALGVSIVVATKAGKRRIAFGISLIGLAVMALVAIVFYEIIAQAYQGISRWCHDYWGLDALAEIFVSMGIINFSFSYIISAQDKQVYGIWLGNVLQEQFPRQGHIFVLYSALILIGLYAAKSDYGLVALVCLLGAISAFIATSVMVFLFSFNRSWQQKMVEQYLRSPPQSSKSWGGGASEPAFSQMLDRSNYIQAYFSANGMVPMAVTSCLWNWLKDSKAQRDAADALGQNSDEPSDYVGSISHISAAWRNILRGVPPEQAAELACCVIQFSLSQEEEGLKAAGDALVTGEGKIDCPEVMVPLCGLIAYLRGDDVEKAYLTDDHRFFSEWRLIFHTIYQISLFRGRLELGQSGLTLRVASRLLFSVTETVYLIERLAFEKLDPSTFGDADALWSEIQSMQDALQVGLATSALFAEWGLNTVCSYKSDWFQMRRSMLEAYASYQQLFSIIISRRGNGPIIT